MIKGINKQIIEIKCTNNEYFDKILLFVNSDKSNVPSEFLAKQAGAVSSDFINSYSRKKSSRKLALQFGLLTGLFCLTAFLLVLFVMFF